MPYPGQKPGGRLFLHHISHSPSTYRPFPAAAAIPHGGSNGHRNAPRRSHNRMSPEEAFPLCPCGFRLRS